jgi:DNA-binding transcriptional LysR family regulator
LPRPAGFDALDAIEIADEPMIPVCAPQRRGTSGYALPASEGEPLVYLPYGRSSYIGRAVDDEVARRVAPVRVQNLFEDPLIFILKELALQGMGVAWLPLSTIQRNLADGSLTHIGGGDWDIAMTVELLRRKKPLPPAAEAVWALLARGAPPARAPLQTARVVPHRRAPGRG